MHRSLLCMCLAHVPNKNLSFYISIEYGQYKATIYEGKRKETFRLGVFLSFLCSYFLYSFCGLLIYPRLKPFKKTCLSQLNWSGDSELASTIVWKQNYSDLCLVWILSWKEICISNWYIRLEYKILSYRRN